MATPLERLLELGQSPWYDNIRRDLIQSGKFRTLVDSGIRGMTANPTIFEKAITGSSDYDEAIRLLVRRGASSAETYEELVVEDIRAAADVLRPIYDRTLGLDGFASVEVAPDLAHDTQGTIAEARKLFGLIGRPNVMVKVPATDEAMAAIRQLTGEGLNINITLIFAVEYYERVIEAYLGGLEMLAAANQPLDRVASVASFFVSRVNAEVDRRLDELIDAAPGEARREQLGRLRGKAAIANARIAYERFQRVFGGERFRALRERGARLQRPLWASTGAKNPSYRDVMYVEQLIGPDTVTTLPPATLEAFQDHGRIERTIDKDLDGAYQSIADLEAAGISMQEVTDKLQADGITSFADSFDRLASAIERKREQAGAVEMRQVAGSASRQRGPGVAGEARGDRVRRH